MIKYNQNDYNEGREEVSGDLVFQLLFNAFKKNDITVDEKICKHILMSFIADLSYILYEEPEQYLDLGKCVIYRSSNLYNLLTIQAKNGENAKSVKDYFDRGGLYSEDLKELVTGFVKDLSVTALEEQQKAMDKVSELTELSEKARESKNKNKGEQHGV